MNRVMAPALLAIAWMAFSSAQAKTPTATGSIRGVVHETDTGEPMKYALAIVVGTRYGTMSSADGSFVIAEVPVGVCAVRVMMMGYRSQTIDSVVVRAGEATELTVALDSFWPAHEAASRSIVGTQTDATRDDLRCEMIPAKVPSRVGDTPAFRVIIHNVAQKAFYLVGAVDGSEGSRYPRARLTFSGPAGVVGPGYIRCGNVNMLRRRDFVRVEPGGSFEPIAKPFFQLLGNMWFQRAGRFTVTFHYSTNAIDYADWCDGRSGWRPDQDVLDMLRQVPRIELVDSITVDARDSTAAR